jgi:hypothetical protein
MATKSILIVKAAIENTEGFIRKVDRPPLEAGSLK